MTRSDSQPGPKRRLLAVLDPGKPISEMTEEELDAFVDLIAGRIEQARPGGVENGDIEQFGSSRSAGGQSPAEE